MLRISRVYVLHHSPHSYICTLHFIHKHAPQIKDNHNDFGSPSCFFSPPLPSSPGLHLGGGGGHSPSLGNFVPPPPPWQFQTFKIEYCSLYTYPPKCLSMCFCPPPPLGIFLNEPLPSPPLPSADDTGLEVMYQQNWHRNSESDFIKVSQRCHCYLI